MKIIPAILEVEAEAVQDKLDIIAAVGNFEAVQIDVIDGQLLPDVTVSPYDLIDLNWENLKVDFHLMTEEPLDFVWEIAAQEEILPVRTVIGQVERMSDQKAFLKAVKDRGWQTALALDLLTPVESIDENSWSNLDKILLMAVPMGKQGQKFDQEVIAKIQELREEITSRNVEIKIMIDGGIIPEKLAELQEAQVDEVAIGSFLWQGDFSEQADELEFFG